MKPKKTEHTPQRDAFLPELADIINPRHELVALTRTIDWEYCERELIDLYADVGRPGASLRLLVGLSLLKHTYALSDEVVVQRWEENPYYQWFCGEQYFQHRCPINPTTLLRFRQRLGEAGMKRLLTITVQAGLDSGTINRDSLRVVSADTTVMNKAIAHPTDARLLKRLQEHLVRQAHRQGIRLRQTYEKDLKRLALAVGRYAHARQFKRMRRVLSRMRTRVGRLARDILRKADPSQPSDALLRTLRQTARVLGQGRDPATPGRERLYSVHAPEVECIGKGKARTPWEFGCKVGVVATANEQFVLSCQAFHGNPYDGHTLDANLISASVAAGEPLPATLVDRGYRGAQGSPFSEVHITGRKRGPGQAHPKQNRRNAIEAVIGHMKTEGLLAENRLLGREGDRINAVLCGIGQNLRLILKKLRLLFGFKFVAMLCAQWRLQHRQLVAIATCHLAVHQAAG